MGPLSRYLGPDVPQQKPLIWQDPLPAGCNSTLTPDDIAQLKRDIMGESCLNISSLVTTAWGSASTFRYSDKRGGANGARIALEPQVSFAANNPERLKVVLEAVGGLLNGCGIAHAKLIDPLYSCDVSQRSLTRQSLVPQYHLLTSLFLVAMQHLKRLQVMLASA